MTEVHQKRTRVVPYRSFALLLLSMVLAAAAYYANFRSYAEIGFTLHAALPGRLQIFHDASGDFSEINSDWISVRDDGWRHVSIWVPGSDAAQLRLDPPSSGTLAICGLGIGRAHKPAQMVVVRSGGLAPVDTGDNCLQLRPEPGAADPQLVVRLVGGSAVQVAAGRWRQAFHCLMLMTLLALAWTAYTVAQGKSATLWSAMAGEWLARFDRSAHWWLAALMLLFGTMYLVVTPPGAVADETAHVSKVVRINGGFPFGDSGTTKMPDVIEIYGPFFDYTGNKSPFTLAQLLEQVRRPLHCEPRDRALPSGASGYFPAQYLLASIVFKASCATGASFGVFLYLSRLLNLLLATALVTWGLRYAGRGKLGLFMVALLPMTMFQISSVSADSLMLSLSLAWLGLVSGIAGRRLHPGRAAPWLLLLAFGIALLKPGSAWVLVCLLCCKPAYDSCGISFRAAIAKFVALPWLIHIAWTFHAAGEFHSRIGVDTEANKGALLHAPLSYIRLMGNTFSGERFMHLGRSMIGVLGWLDVFLAPWAYWLAASALVATLWTNDPAVQPARGTRPLALLFAIGSLGVIGLPLYLYWTLPGAQFVQGLQGRYFTMTAAFLLVWCSFRAPAWVRAIIVAVVLAVAPVLNLDAMYHLYDSYFVTGRAG